MDWLHFSGNAEMDVKMSSIFQIIFPKMILKFVVTKIAKDDLWVRNCKSFLRRKAKKKSELWKPVIRLAEQYPPSFITATAKRSEWKVGRRQKKKIRATQIEKWGKIMNAKIWQWLLRRSRLLSLHD